jgi:hypothetical protein
MSELAMDILTPTVVAAIVSGGALIAREMLAGRFTARQSRDEQDLRRQGLVIEQVRLLWTQNATLRRREADCERRCRLLARRCAELERVCGVLRRRVDRLGRLVARRRRRRR